MSIKISNLASQLNVNGDQSANLVGALWGGHCHGRSHHHTYKHNKFEKKKATGRSTGSCCKKKN
jgi:hypothetical protein